MTNEEKHNFLLRFQKFQQNRERYFAPPIYKAIRQQYKVVINNVKTIGLESSLNLINGGQISAILTDLYVDAGTVYGAKIRADLNRQKARMPIGFSEAMKQLLIDYFSVDILNASEGITETTKDLIRQVFTNGYEIGLGIDDLIVQLENTELSRIRARLIARTETVTSANKGAMFVAKQSGLNLKKEWLSTMDARTRNHHLSVDGQIVGFDDFFNVGGYDMAQPGDRGGKEGKQKVPAAQICNCRCAVLPIPV